MIRRTTVRRNLLARTSLTTTGARGPGRTSVLVVEEIEVCLEDKNKTVRLTVV